MPESRNNVYQKIGAIAGIAAPITAFTCILSSIASYPAFSWTNNALSDLGVVTGTTSSIFNLGLIVSGLLAFTFAIFGLLNYLGPSWMNKIGLTIFALASLALIAIGVFNEHFSPTHYLVSVAFFALTPISLLLLTYGFWRCNQHSLAIFTFSVGVIAALPWVLQFAFNYVPNVAIPETLSGLTVSGWAVILAQKIIKSLATS